MPSAEGGPDSSSRLSLQAGLLPNIENRGKSTEARTSSGGEAGYREEKLVPGESRQLRDYFLPRVVGVMA